MTEREVMSWADLGAGARSLAEAVADDIELAVDVLTEALCRIAR